MSEEKKLDYRELWLNLKRYVQGRLANSRHLDQMNGVTAFEVIGTIMEYSETVQITLKVR